MNIFKFEFKRQIKGCIVWSIICSILIAFFMALYPSMSNSSMQELVNSKMSSIPSELLKVLNIENGLDFSNIYDYLTYAIQYIAIASAVYASILGVNSLIKEESEGTIEFLYSKPIKRSKIVTQKLLSIIVIYCIYIIIVGIITMISCIIVKSYYIRIIDIIINIKLIFASILIIGLIFMSIGILVSSLIKSSKSSISLSISIFFISYFLGIISKLKEGFEWFRFLSPLYYYPLNNIIENGFELKFILVSLFIIIGSIIGSYIIYNKKDMNI